MAVLDKIKTWSSFLLKLMLKHTMENFLFQNLRGLHGILLRQLRVNLSRRRPPPAGIRTRGQRRLRDDGELHAVAFW